MKYLGLVLLSLSTFLSLLYMHQSVNLNNHKYILFYTFYINPVLTRYFNIIFSWILLSISIYLLVNLLFEDFIHKNKF